jgi:hypothetical protein
MPVQDPSSSPSAAGGGGGGARAKRTSSAPIRPADYAHSPTHHCVALRDAAGLQAILAGLPPLAHPSRVLTAADAAREARLASSVAAALDRRDVPGGDTALHLAVRLRLSSLASALAAAGADPTLQNHAGWTPLQEALCLGCREIAACLLRAHRLAAWAKLRRRAPALSAALRRVQDFYLEVDFHFESSVVPLLSRAAPSDTYRIWKRGTDLRADTTLAGFDGLRIRRADHSFLFFGEETSAGGRRLPPGSLLVLHRGRREVHDAFAAAAAAGDEDAATSDAAAYRPGLNITSARLVPRTTWLRKEKTENVGEWKARVFDVHNVVFSFRTLKAASAGRKDFTFELAGDEDGDEDDDEFLPLEIRDDDEDGDFLVADIPPPFALGDPAEAEEQRGRAAAAAGVRVGRARRGRHLRPSPRDDDDGWSQVEGGGDGEDAAAVGVAHGGLPPERRRIPAAAGHPGQPRARRAPSPRAAHHQVPTRDLPGEGNAALLLNKKSQNYIYFFVSGFSG